MSRKCRVSGVGPITGNNIYGTAHIAKMIREGQINV
jgi:ribosomal protein L28